MSHGSPSASQLATYREIYDEVVRFYEACARGGLNLSDTWVHSIKRKGSRYSFDEMLTMRRPGSFVTLHINTFDYFVDGTRVDAAIPIVKALLEAGESDVGQPLRDVPLAGKRFSSVYLKHLDIAAEMIGYLSAKGIERPTLLEIGGGQGLLLAALRAWYGDRLTIIAADIPETLFYQAYFLRATYPDIPVSYRPGAEPVPVVSGGFNFVNAYELAKQRYAIDIAINANSMQEMTGEVANAYLAYIDSVIAPNGTLFFRNSFGHALGSVSEPSEYNFGPRWHLTRAGYGDFFTDSSATEFASFVFNRTNAEDDKSRRLALRILWNGFAAGRLTPGGAAARAVVAASGHAPVAEMAREMDARLGRPGWTTTLCNGAHLPAAEYADPTDPLDLREGDARWHRLTVIRAAQRRLTAAMDAGDRQPLDRVRRDVADLGARLVEEARATDFAASDYWTGYAAAILVGLGQGEQAKPLLVARAAQSDHAYWRLRFAWLLARAGAAPEARQILKTVRRDDLDVFWWPSVAGTTHALGETSEAASWLDAASGHAGEQGTDELRHCLFRMNVRCGRLDVAARLFDELADVDAARRAGNRLGLVACLLRMNPGEQERARALLGRIMPIPAPSPALAEVLHRLGDHARASEMAHSLMQAGWDSYYTLGGVARALLAMGDDAEAERCMIRSVELRPGAVRHFDFLANVSFEAGHFALAARWFAELLTGKPYDDLYRGRAAFARLPAAARESGAFGSGDDQAMIFQTYQSFYYPEGPQIR